MLNGVMPILVIQLKPILLSTDIKKAIAGIPVIGKSLASFGAPIPLYLDEKLTGLSIGEESKSIDVDTRIESQYNGQPAIVYQRGIDSVLNISMTATKDSTLLNILLSLSDIILDRVIGNNYAIHYLNGPTTIFNAVLKSFNTSVSTNDNLIRITMQLSRTNSSTKVTNATPYLSPTPTASLNTGVTA